MFRHQTFRLCAGSFLFLALCQGGNLLLNPPLVCNEGIGFGINIPIFILVPLIALALTIAGFFIWKVLTSTPTPSPLASFGSALLTGGALSNIIDRLIRGCVPDYFALGWFPAFNTADIGISIGTTLLLIAILKK